MESKKIFRACMKKIESLSRREGSLLLTKNSIQTQHGEMMLNKKLSQIRNARDKLEKFIEKQIYQGDQK